MSSSRLIAGSVGIPARRSGLGTGLRRHVASFPVVKTARLLLLPTLSLHSICITTVLAIGFTVRIILAPVFGICLLLLISTLFLLYTYLGLRLPLRSLLLVTVYRSHLLC